MAVKNIEKDIKYIGVNDKNIDLFEGQYPVPNGMAYNSYAIIDEKCAVFDTSGEGFCDEWLSNIDKALNGKKPDYLIVSHMEPDHSSCIKKFADKYKKTVIVATAQAFTMIENFFSEDYADRKRIVKNGDTLSLGTHKLTFYQAPMVHWPEVMMTYDETDKVLFSADAFGKFGALDTDEDWSCEARRYYFGIVGKFGVQVQAVLNKLSGLEINRICSLHGPVLEGDLSYYLNLYNTWSSYKPEKSGVVIAYTSVYGHTKKAVMKLRDELIDNGCDVVDIYDLARCDMFEAIEAAFEYDRLVLATTTYNTDIFPFMRTFINHLTERSYKNRKVAFIENGSWAPNAEKVMRSMLSECKDLEYADNNVHIKSAINDSNLKEISALAKELN